MLTSSVSMTVVVALLITLDLIISINSYTLNSNINITTFNNNNNYDKTYKNIQNKLTIRVNTFRRLDLIESFLDYYSHCDVIYQIQIIWSDQLNKPPINWQQRYPEKRYVVELHYTDSLSNRFRPLVPITTEAVLSIDDDLLITCSDLKDALDVWSSNKRALVGFSPRMHGYDIISGAIKYYRWQHTWWSGMYTIILTKAAIMNRQYLYEYDKLLPEMMIKHIDKQRNCEDIAMAYVVALKSQAPPVWVSANVWEVGNTGSGISSGGSHFNDRSNCLQVLKDMTTPSISPWVTGYQKYIPISWLDIYYLWYDIK